jgi:hypothetical protein
MKTNILNKFNNYHEYKQSLIFKLKHGIPQKSESLDQTYRRIIKEKSSEMKQAQTTQAPRQVEQTENANLDVQDVKRKIFEFANIIIETPEAKTEPKEEKKSNLIVEEITLTNRVLVQPYSSHQ